MSLSCNTLQHTATHCNTRLSWHWMARCNTLKHTAIRCNTLQHTATQVVFYDIRWLIAAHCNTLQHTATRVVRDIWWCIAIRCSTLQHTATYCSTLQHESFVRLHDSLQHIATHCNTLQHNVTHSDTLQNTATHCNTLQHKSFVTMDGSFHQTQNISVKESDPCIIKETLFYTLTKWYGSSMTIHQTDTPQIFRVWHHSSRDSFHQTRRIYTKCTKRYGSFVTFHKKRHHTTLSWCDITRSWFFSSDSFHQTYIFNESYHFVEESSFYSSTKWYGSFVMFKGSFHQTLRRIPLKEFHHLIKETWYHSFTK